MEKKATSKRKNNLKKSTDPNYLYKNQIEGRNLNSIVLRNFTNFLNRHPKFRSIVEDIIQRKKFNFTAK